jgi:sporulation protein YlmC with PRC-barrel domain
MNRKTLRISDLLSCRIVTADGKVVGRVADVQLTPAPEYRITALLFGPRAWLLRLHMLNPFASRPSAKAPNRVLWETIDRIEPPTITLKPGCAPEKHDQEVLEPFPHDEEGQ